MIYTEEPDIWLYSTEPSLLKVTKIKVVPKNTCSMAIELVLSVQEVFLGHKVVKIAQYPTK